MAVGGMIIDDSGSDDGENQKFTREVFKVAVLSAIGGFLFGYDTGIVSGAMVYIKTDLELDYEWQELVISITILGAWIFSLVAAQLATRYGRKKVIYAASIIFTVGSLEMAAAWDRWSLLIGRFVVGAAVGLASMVIPMYIAEMAPARVRGSLVTTNNLFIGGGQAVAAVLAGIFGLINAGSLRWRLMLGFAAIPSAIQFVGFLFMPESPRWLVSKSRDSEAKSVLKRLRGPDAVIDKEFDSIKATCDSNANQDDGFFRIVVRVWKDSHLRKALIMGCLLQTVQQLTGINTVMYYAATIIQLSGVYDPQKAVWMAAATATLNFLINFLGIYLVEKIGRRKLLLFSLAGVIMSLGILAIGFHVLDKTSPILAPISDNSSGNYTDKCMEKQLSTCFDCNQLDECGFCFNPDKIESENYCFALDGDSKTSSQHSANGSMCYTGTTETIVWAPTWCPSPHSWLVLFGLCIYLLTFGPGLGPMPWTINSELFPLWCRSVCYSITTAFNWLFNLIVSLTFLTLTRVITKPGAFWLYAGLGLIGFIIFFFFLPETKGRSLESDIGPLLDQQEELSRRRASSVTSIIRRKASLGRSLSRSGSTDTTSKR